MNTRGLTELVILNVGRQLGVLDDELFTMLVLMALITTAMTGPLLKRVYSDRVHAAGHRRRRTRRPGRHRFLPGAGAGRRPAARPRRWPRSVPRCWATGRPAEVVLSRLIVRPKAPLEVGAAVVPDLARMAAPSTS